MRAGVLTSQYYDASNRMLDTLSNDWNMIEDKMSWLVSRHALLLTSRYNILLKYELTIINGEEVKQIITMESIL